MTLPPDGAIRLVIFDCDGVLVDSEGPANRTVAEEVSALGWAMDEAESMRQFVGFTLEQMSPVIEARIERPVPPGWTENLRRRIVRVMETEVELVPGVADVLAGLSAMGLPYRVASNSSRAEMAAKFARTGLSHLLPVVHSAYDVARGKPAPDVYLAAAAAGGMRPGQCLVVEDSVPGATAAHAAGMTCIGLDRHGDGAALRALGAHVIEDLAALLPLLRAARRAA